MMKSTNMTDRGNDYRVSFEKTADSVQWIKVTGNDDDVNFIVRVDSWKSAIGNFGKDNDLKFARWIAIKAIHVYQTSLV